MASGGLSIHVVDVARGVPAQGMRVGLRRRHSLPRDDAACWQELFVGWPLDENGKISTVSFPKIDWCIGVYEATFDIGAYFARARLPQPDFPFLDRFPFHFNIGDPTRHHHLPLKVTPWGLSLFLTV